MIDATNITLDPDEGLEERDILFNAYLEGDLDPEEQAAFDQRLESDPDFKADYEEFETVVGGLRELPFEFAPDDFVDRVQSRIRTRSAGRFFAEQFLFTTRVPYEVVAVVMIIVMAAAYMFMEAPRDAQMEDVEVPTKLETPAARD